jgi:hypothetical protein
MPSLFKHISQIQSRADYDKLLRKSLAPDSVTEGTGPAEEFHYFEEFPFDKKPGTLLLVGDVSKGLLGELRKLGTGYARGTCRMTPNHRVLVDIETGKVKPKLINGTLKTSGLKLQAVVNGEEPEPDSDLGEASSKPEPSPELKTPVTPEKTEKVKVPPSPEQQQWMDKVKVLRPAFDKALQLARSTDPRWAEDLDSNFAQMMQEARGGDFKTAMETLKRLAVILRSREAARAEVKHQTMMEDPEVAQSFRDEAQRRREAFDFSAEQLEQNERDLDAEGIGLTSDGTSTHQKALTLAEWKSGVNEPLRALTAMLKDGRQRDLSYGELMTTLKTLKQTTASAQTLAMDEEDRPDLQQLTSTLADSIESLYLALQYLARGARPYKLRPETLLMTVEDVNREFQGTLMAMSQLAKQGKFAKKPKDSLDEQGQRRRLEEAAAKQHQLARQRVEQLERQDKELASKLQKLKNLPPDESLTESERRERQEANEDRMQDLEEERQVLSTSIQQAKKLLDIDERGEISEEHREWASSIDTETFEQAMLLWQQQSVLVQRHIKAAAWDDAVVALDKVNQLLSVQTGKSEGGFSLGLSELSSRMYGLIQDCIDAKRTAESTPAAALKALKPVIQGCAEFQRLYFK